MLMFGLTEQPGGPDWTEHVKFPPPRWNVAPSQRMPIVRMSDAGFRELAIARWGLVPSWAKEMPKVQPINARAETVPTGPMFRKAFECRRCLVPADGFYEWKGAKPPKQPYFIHQPDDGQFAFAGLWERWRASKDAEPLDTYTIITTSPNALMASIHNRMLLAPYRDDGLEAYPVSQRVNSPKNDDADCVKKMEAI